MDTYTGSTGGDLAPLGLSAVLVSSLPHTLLTADAPDRYTVEAVFDRRPDAEEVSAIRSDETHRMMADLGYPDADIEISDRRLRIAGTNLEELRDGLAGVIAKRLADVSLALRSRRDADRALLRAVAGREEDRAAKVAALAESVRFTPRALVSVTSDEDRIADWYEEGGSAR